MTYRMLHHGIRSIGIATLMAGLMIAGAACDSTSALQQKDAEQQVPELSGALETVLADLSLTASQRAEFSDFADPARNREPGVLWRMAARLQTTLTAEQTRQLFDRGESHQRGRDRWQPMRGERPRQHLRQLRHMARRLELSEDQRSAVRTLVQRYAEQQRQLWERREEGTLTRDDLRTLRKQFREDLFAILTDDQREQWEQQREARKARREQIQAVRADVLELSTDQREALKALREDQRAARQAAMDAFLKGEIDRQEVRRRLRALRAERRSEAADILTTRQTEIIRLHRVLVARVRHKRHSAQ